MDVEDVRFHKKIMNLNLLFFHPDMLEKKLQFLVPLSIFCGFWLLNCALHGYVFL